MDGIMKARVSDWDGSDCYESETKSNWEDDWEDEDEFDEVDQAERAATCPSAPDLYHKSQCAKLNLRFSVGERVLCNMGSEWAAGQVIVRRHVTCCPAKG